MIVLSIPLPNELTHFIPLCTKKRKTQNKTGLSKKIDKSDRKNMQGIFPSLTKVNT